MRYGFGYDAERREALHDIGKQTVQVRDTSESWMLWGLLAVVAAGLVLAH